MKFIFFYNFKKILILLTLMMTLSITIAKANVALNWNNSSLIPLVQFFTQTKLAESAWPTLSTVSQEDLPKPYDFLLTQPVMTLGLASYYKRTPKVRPPLYVLENTQQKTYSRGIIMIVDNDATRNNAAIADTLHDTTIVELGLITMNIAALPPAVIDGVKHSNTPFGALLAQNNINTHDSNRHFFKIECNALLNKNLGCTLKQTLYGRTNTLVNQQGVWIAHVVEILTGNKIPENLV